MKINENNENKLNWIKQHEAEWNQMKINRGNKSKRKLKNWVKINESKYNSMKLNENDWK
jgi:hypothetical protein